MKWEEIKRSEFYVKKNACQSYTQTGEGRLFHSGYYKEYDGFLPSGDGNRKHVALRIEAKHGSKLYFELR